MSCSPRDREPAARRTATSASRPATPPARRAAPLPRSSGSSAAPAARGPEDYAYLYGWGASNFSNSITPGSQRHLHLQRRRPRQRRRRVLRGRRAGASATSVPARSGSQTVDCDSDGDNAAKQTTVTFPDRGAFVVEAELRNGDTLQPHREQRLLVRDRHGGRQQRHHPGARRSPQRGRRSTATRRSRSIRRPTPTAPTAAARRSSSGTSTSTRATASPASRPTPSPPRARSSRPTRRRRSIRPGSLPAPTRFAPGSSTTARWTPPTRSAGRLPSPPRPSSSTRRPIANDGARQRTETETPVSVTMPATDANGDTLTYTPTSGPSNGTLSPPGAGTSTRTYTPDARLRRHRLLHLPGRRTASAEQTPTTVTITV